MTKEAIKEIARMQYVIDGYETSLRILAGMCQNRRDAPIPLFATDCSHWIETIYWFIKEHINEGDGNKDCEVQLPNSNS